MLPSIERTYWLATYIAPHEPALRAWLRGQRVAGLEPDDIVQETYAILAGLTSVDHIESPRAYAFQTAQSLIRRHLRRRRIVQFEGLDERDASVHASDAPSPEQHLAARQELWRVRDLIDALPSRRREAFVLRRIEGLSQRDIAQRMGISESVVEKHIGRALRYLMDATGRGASGAETARESGSGRHGQARNQLADRRGGGGLGRAPGPRGALA